MQKVLFDLDAESGISKSVRNASYHNLDDQEKMLQCQIVFSAILNHPEGITDHEIEHETELPINIVTARRNDVKQSVKVVGLASYHNGKRLIINTLWGAI